MGEKINADMSANVWKILVSPGDRVEPDQPLMILESMKMEIPVTSEDGGVVQQLHVTEGENVTAGRLLAEID
jgi:acetyl-CoA carboxylase biotin carboxyl carrier protein